MGNLQSKLIATTMEESIDKLVKARSVRSWYLCSTPEDEAHQFSSQTTSIKMYLDEDGKIYLAGDYIKGDNDIVMSQFRYSPMERNSVIAMQGCSEVSTTIVIQKNPSICGNLRFSEIKDYLGEFSLKVLQATGNNNKSLDSRFYNFERHINYGNVAIITDSFDGKTLLTLLNQLNSFAAEGKHSKGNDEFIWAIIFGQETLASLGVPVEGNKQDNSKGKDIKVLVSTGGDSFSVDSDNNTLYVPLIYLEDAYNNPLGKCAEFINKLKEDIKSFKFENGVFIVLPSDLIK